MKLFCRNTTGVVNSLLTNGVEEKRIVALATGEADESAANFGLKTRDVSTPKR